MGGKTGDHTIIILKDYSVELPHYSHPIKNRYHGYSKSCHFSPITKIVTYYMKFIGWSSGALL